MLIVIVELSEKNFSALLDSLIHSLRTFIRAPDNTGGSAATNKLS